MKRVVNRERHRPGMIGSAEGASIRIANLNGYKI